MAVNTGIPKGTRDFIPMEMVRRNLIFDTIREVFCLYGYLPIETPAMENLSTLLGKYGEEGDRLIFKILNSGDFLSEVDTSDPVNLRAGKLINKISEKALRYDLTVPFARFVVQHRTELTFPFKRYQIQPVWRADRPQKGRYREFFQCDVDVIGSNSLLYEVELMQIIDDVFGKLGINVIMHINNRKILVGIAEAIGQPDKFMDFTIAVDKLDKIGTEKVMEELLVKDFPKDAVERLKPLFEIRGSYHEKAEILRPLLAESEIGMKGIAEMDTIFSYLDDCGLNAFVEFNITLARGLNYYTGAIFEVKAKDVNMGSICGGGRYDDLTGIFGLPDVSGVGVSFGADRIYDVMNELKIFPHESSANTKVLFVNFGGQEERYSLKILEQFHRVGVNAEIYPDPVKIKKQLAYADAKNIPYVAMIGSEEMKSRTIKLKNMKTSDQINVELEELVRILKG